MTYLVLNLLLLAFPLAYWLARRSVPWRAWALLVALGFAFDLIEYNVIRIWTPGPGPTFLGMPVGEYAFILGLPLRAIAIYELSSVCFELFRQLERARRWERQWERTERGAQRRQRREYKERGGTHANHQSHP